MKPLLFDVKPLLKSSIYIKEIKTAHLNDQFHYHNVFEIALILKGSGRRIVGDCVDNFTHGDLIIIAPNTPHANYSDKKYHVKDPTTNVHSIVVYFQPDWISESHMKAEEFAPIRMLLNRIKRGIKINKGSTHTEVVRLLLKLKETRGMESFLILFNILHEICISNEYSYIASPRYTEIQDENVITRLHEVYKYVMENFTNDILLDHVASIMCMTSSSFCRFFKDKTTKTFTHFVNEIRIGYACELLINENLDISQICFQSGFNNFTSFNKNFKKYTNKTPSDYRENLTRLSQG